MATGERLPRPRPDQLQDLKEGYLHDPFWARELNQQKRACTDGQQHDWHWWGWEGSFNLDWCKRCNWVAYEGQYEKASQNIYDLRWAMDQASWWAK